MISTFLLHLENPCVTPSLTINLGWVPWGNVINSFCLPVRSKEEWLFGSHAFPTARHLFTNLMSSHIVTESSVPGLASH